MKNLLFVTAGVLSLGIGSATLKADPTSKDQVALTSIIANPKHPGLFDSTDYRVWSMAAGAAIKNLGEISEWSDQTKWTLICAIAAPEEYSPLKNPYGEGFKNNKQLNNDIRIDSFSVSPIGPISTILASHKVNEAVPFLVARYEHEEYYKTKIALYEAIVKFHDPAALPVIRENLRRHLTQDKLDWEIMVYDTIPTIRKAAESSDAFTREQAEKLLEQIREANGQDVLVQDSLAGKITARDPNLQTIRAQTPTGKSFVTIVPTEQFKQGTEKNLNEHGQQLDAQGQQISDLDGKQAALTNRVAKNEQDFQNAMANIRTVLQRQADELAKSAKAIDGLSERLDKNEYSMTKFKEDLESQANALNVSRKAIESLQGTSEKNDKKLTEAVGAIDALQGKVTKLQETLNSIEAAKVAEQAKNAPATQKK